MQFFRPLSTTGFVFLINYYFILNFFMQQLTPVQAGERETFMDVLRGFAILGIFIANLGSGLSWYSDDAKLTGPFLIPGWDHKMTFLHHMFIEGKFYSIFSLLFGWGLHCK